MSVFVGNDLRTQNWKAITQQKPTLASGTALSRLAQQTGQQGQMPPSTGTTTGVAKSAGGDEAGSTSVSHSDPTIFKHIRWPNENDGGSGGGSTGPTFPGGSGGGQAPGATSKPMPGAGGTSPVSRPSSGSAGTASQPSTNPSTGSSGSSAPVRSQPIDKFVRWPNENDAAPQQGNKSIGANPKFFD